MAYKPVGADENGNFPPRVAAKLNATYQTVLIQSGSTYPPRPAGVPAGMVKYKGTATPTDKLTGDEWDDPTVVVADTTAPSAVTGLTAGTATATTVPLSWTAATDAVGVTGYEYSTNGTTYTSTGSTGTTYTVTGLTAGTAYTLYVRAFDAAGNKGTAATVAKTTAAAAIPSEAYDDVALTLAPTNYVRMNEATAPMLDTGSAPKTLAIVGGLTLGAAGIGDGVTAANFSTNGYFTAGTGSFFSADTSGSFALLVKPTTANSGFAEAGGAHFYMSAGKMVIKFGATVITSTGSTLTAGTRYHLGYTWDGTNIKFYVNGVLDSTVASTTTAGASGTANNVGLGGGFFMNGIGAGLIVKKGTAYTAANMLALAQAAGL